MSDMDPKLVASSDATNVVIEPEVAAVKPRRIGPALKKFLSSPTAAIGTVTLIAVCLIALFAPWLASQNPYDLLQLDILDSRLPPGSESFDGIPYYLGTDGQ